MDDDFISKLKSFSVKDVLQDQRPSTSRMSRLKSGRQTSRFVDTSKVINEGDGVVEKKIKLGTGDSAHTPMENEFEKSSITTISELLNSRPETAAFKRKETPWYLKTEDADTGDNRIAHRKTKTAIHNEETVDYIPDLNEIREEDFTQTVAVAPEAEAERITSLRELDADLARIKSFSVVRGVDLRELTKFVFPEKSLIDLEEKKPKCYETRIGGLLPLVNGKRLIEFKFPNAEPTEDYDFPNIAPKFEAKVPLSIQEPEFIRKSKSSLRERKDEVAFDEMDSELSETSRW